MGFAQEKSVEINFALYLQWYGGIPHWIFVFVLIFICIWFVCFYIWSDLYLALGDRFWLFIQTLNSARKSFNSIFNSKENSKYSFKESILSKRKIYSKQEDRSTIRLESNDINQIGLGLYNILKLGPSFLLSPLIDTVWGFLCLSMIKCMPFNSPMTHFLHVMRFFSHNLFIFLTNNAFFPFIQLFIQ